jgi:diguanylate cyclase (GGDEF)-like protein
VELIGMADWLPDFLSEGTMVQTGNGDLREFLHALLTGDLEGADLVLPKDVRDEETCDLLRSLRAMFVEFAAYSGQISKVRYSLTIPPQNNYLAEDLKALQSRWIRLDWQLKQVAMGDYDQTVDYMGDLSELLNLIIGLLRQNKVKADYENNHDSFTGLLTRKAFMREVHDIIKRQPEKSGALLCGGLDNLRNINDIYGHDVGDQYILQATAMYQRFEKSGGLVSRISGDEFAVYMHGFNNGEQALTYIRSIIEKEINTFMFVYGAFSQRIRSSIGMASYPGDAGTVSELIKYANYAMYEVKKDNRGAVARFNSGTYFTKTRSFEKEEALNVLIEERRIRFAFQPIVDLEDGSVYGYEALMRSDMKDFSSPLEIIGVAENQSKLYQIERLTFEEILNWVDQNLQRIEGKKIFFNVITDRFLNGDEMSRIKANYARLLDNMVFEVLESTTDEDAFLARIASFQKEFGAMVAIDDFGCGNSNQFRLMNLDSNIVKVDRFFIKESHLSSEKQSILQSVVSFCKGKGIKVLAEGVETLEELQTVRKLGFHYGQGFFFAKPEFEINPNAHYEFT